MPVVPDVAIATHGYCFACFWVCAYAAACSHKDHKEYMQKVFFMCFMCKCFLKRFPMLQGPKACMGPGTGLGQANLYWSENFGTYRVWPSEGAHASFAPRGWKQRALQTHVERQLGYCEIEHVSSPISQLFAVRLCLTLCLSA